MEASGSEEVSGEGEGFVGGFEGDAVVGGAEDVSGEEDERSMA